MTSLSSTDIVTQNYQRANVLFGHVHADAVRFDRPMADFVHNFTFDSLASVNRSSGHFSTQIVILSTPSSVISTPGRPDHAHSWITDFFNIPRVLREPGQIACQSVRSGLC